MSRIAVVEDNADNRLLVQAMLDDRYELVQFDNGSDALVAMRQLPPDLVLMDISLPGMDGIEVLRRMRESIPLRSIPVIALTAHAMTGDRERFISAGFDGYVTKPIIDEDILVDAIEDLLGRDDVRRSA